MWYKTPYQPLEIRLQNLATDKTPYQPLEIGLKNLATDIGTYFWPSSVDSLRL